MGQDWGFREKTPTQSHHAPHTTNRLSVCRLKEESGRRKAGPTARARRARSPKLINRFAALRTEGSTSPGRRALPRGSGLETTTNRTPPPPYTPTRGEDH